MSLHYRDGVLPPRPSAHHEMLQFQNLHLAVLRPLDKRVAEVVEENQAGELRGHARLLVLQQRRGLLLPVADHQRDLRWERHRRQELLARKYSVPTVFSPKRYGDSRLSGFSWEGREAQRGNRLFFFFHFLLRHICMTLHMKILYKKHKIHCT